jgi:hypothetical protein
MTRFFMRVLAIVILPLAGLAALWAQSEYLSHQGTDWEVPIQGYDPRDLLRGHYVEFTYDWPIREEDIESDEDDPSDRVRFNRRPPHLCLIGDPPLIVEAIRFDDPNDPGFVQCEHKLSVQPNSVYGNRSLNRGRLYVGQERASQIEQELRKTDQRGIVSFRQRDDGVLSVLDIRFRPLTDAERAQREGDERGVDNEQEE